MEIFFLIHNPTELNKQGNDVGTQYRSAIFYSNDKQYKVAKKAIKKAQLDWKDRIVTELSNSLNFTKAEEYHHSYFSKNPESMYCNLLIPPKIKKFKDSFPNFFKK